MNEIMNPGPVFLELQKVIKMKWTFEHFLTVEVVIMKSSFATRIRHANVTSGCATHQTIRRHQVLRKGATFLEQQSLSFVKWPLLTLIHSTRSLVLCSKLGFHSELRWVDGIRVKHNETLWNLLDTF